MANQQNNNNIKKGIKTASKIALAKFNLATIKIQLIVGAVILILLILIVLIMGIISAIIDGTDTSSGEINGSIPPGQAMVSNDVLQYRELVMTELEKYELEQYTEVLLALMMQESGGRGNDPMQSSESYCGSVGCITSPELSIEKGVLHFKKVLEKANNDIQLALQSYNFGGEFIDYVKENGGKYTFDLAVEFSKMKYEQVKDTGNYSCLRDEALQYNACFGDIYYVKAVYKYIPQIDSDTELVKGGFKSPLKVALEITSPFSWRDIGSGDEHHDGVDLSCHAPDSIHAAKDGEVIFSGKMGGYGNYVLIKHAENLYTGYGHMSSIFAKKNEHIKAGNKVGICGSTGRSTGEHLHFEIKTEEWSGFKDPTYSLGLD